MLFPLVLVFVSLGLLSLLLFGVSWFEQRVLSPQSLILHAARSRQARPEHAERLVAMHSESLLKGLRMRPAEAAERPGTLAGTGA
jgi:hypothetical protein